MSEQSTPEDPKIETAQLDESALEDVAGGGDDGYHNGVDMIKL